MKNLKLILFSLFVGLSMAFCAKQADASYRFIKNYAKFNYASVWKTENGSKKVYILIKPNKPEMICPLDVKSIVDKASNLKSCTFFFYKPGYDFTKTFAYQIHSKDDVFSIGLDNGRFTHCCGKKGKYNVQYKKNKFTAINIEKINIEKIKNTINNYDEIFFCGAHSIKNLEAYENQLKKWSFEKKRESNQNKNHHLNLPLFLTNNKYGLIKKPELKKHKNRSPMTTAKIKKLEEAFNRNERMRKMESEGREELLEYLTKQQINKKKNNKKIKFF